MAKLAQVVEFLDRVLETKGLQDSSHNGLQVQNGGRVRRVACGVSATLEFFEAAHARSADLLICHHGLSWGDSLKRITGLNHRLVSFAIGHNIAVYAVHLPLDAHARYGNNAQLCKALGLTHLEPAFAYHGETIGFTAAYAKALPFAAFCERVRETVNPEIRVLDFGKKRVKTVGVVSGGASDMIGQAAGLGVDVYLTGEPSLQGYNQAEHLNQNVVFAGHYATETFGVRALAKLITRRLRIPAEFVDFKIPY